MARSKPGATSPTSTARTTCWIRTSASSTCGSRTASWCARAIRRRLSIRRCLPRATRLETGDAHETRLEQGPLEKEGRGLPMKKPRIVTKNGLIAAVDVGSSKICCFIARLADDGKPNVVGIGHQISRGVRQGAIIDMEQAEMAVLSTVHAAEQMAEETITDVVINLSGGYPASQTIGVEVPLSGREIGDHDLQRVLIDR